MFAENGMVMEKDVIFETAERYVKATGRSVFLTGKAGTGKTTFLKYITETTAKRYVVLAPTGVAAINAGGSTIHSFFQLPLCPYLPDVEELITEYQMPERYRSLRKERVNIIRTLDLLIIDEISMVRADLLDAVDMTLRKYRRNDRPFGGVQLLMIGDAQQLSPVVKDSERQYMSQVYPSPYFFHSKALSKLSYVTIELQKVHRQKDEDFLEILNAVRENRLTGPLLSKLNERVGVEPPRMDDGTEPIRLTTHNARADEVNIRKMAALDGEPYSFIAQVEGDFPEHAYPAEEELQLKPGAQVMFIRNDSDGNYYNGKLGRVEKISNGVVTVIDQEGKSIDVAPVEWPNAQYELDDESGEICQNVVGTFRQIPLRVAWAITIHKSQGLTFDNVIIDAGAAFAFGQVYVALSRCRSLEGIVMESPVRASVIYGDEHVAAFNASAADPESIVGALDAEEKGFAYGKYREVFEFGSICSSFRYLLKLWSGVLQDTYTSEYNSLQEAYDIMSEASKVADTFRQQISAIERRSLSSDRNDDSYLHERLLKSAGYFLPLVKTVRDACMNSYGLEIDNKETRKKVTEVLDELLMELDILFYSLEAFQAECFDVERLCRVRTQCVLADRKHIAGKRRLRKVENSGSGSGVVNEELRERLQQWRSERFKKDNVPAYTIIHQDTLLQIASVIPVTKEELLSIKGFGETRYKKYGPDIIAICREFRDAPEGLM
ncbi:MAG: AAA family ATPase [Bacteroidales bacterium]|nr:AAA family ATPase [Bacteroidales bacterium]